MNKYIPLSALILSLCIQTDALAKNEDWVTIPNGFATASKWRSLPTQQRMAYVLGVVDGLKFSSVMSQGADDRVTKFANCTGQMNVDQILAIVEKKVDAQPEFWHESVHFRIFEALTQACRIFK